MILSKYCIIDLRPHRYMYGIYTFTRNLSGINDSFSTFSFSYDIFDGVIVNSFPFPFERAGKEGMVGWVVGLEKVSHALPVAPNAIRAVRLPRRRRITVCRTMRASWQRRPLI